MSICLVHNYQEKKAITLSILKSLPTYFEDQQAIIEYADKSKDYLLFAMKEQEEYIGFIAINCIDDNLAEIEVMGVLPQFFRKKFGTRLFYEAYNYLREKQYKVIQVKTVKLGVYEEYDRTNYFYKKLGFIEKEVLHIWGKENPCQLYELNII